MAPTDIARLVEHISEFSLAAMQEYRTQKSRRTAMKFLNTQLIVDAARASRGSSSSLQLGPAACGGDSPATAVPKRNAGASGTSESQRRKQKPRASSAPAAHWRPTTKLFWAQKSSAAWARSAVDLGSRVKKGQAIARIDQSDYRLRVEQAEAALQQSRVSLGLPPSGNSDKVDIEANLDWSAKLPRC